MNRIALTLTLIGATSFALTGCSADPNDQLLGGGGSNAGGFGSLAAGEENTHQHEAQMGTGENGVTDPADVRAAQAQVGSPEVVARLHGCTKIPVAALGTILSSRGVNIGSNTANSAGQLYRTGAAALGAPNFGARVPEATFASTASAAKMFDIFNAASNEIVTAFANSSGCNGTQLVNNNQFTKEGISCLIGKPATDAHVALANTTITEAPNANAGIRIAISALLSAANTCE
jgi:hypothetical protein